MTAAPSTEAAPSAVQQEPRPLLADWRVHMWAIMLIAFIPRLIYLAQIYHWPFFLHPILDSRTQNTWAGILLQTLGIGNTEVLAKPPLYAYYLTFIKAFVGTGDLSLLTARFVQLAMGSVTCGLAYLVGRRVFGVAVALLGALLLALYSPGIFNDGELLDTALATLLATAFLLTLLAALDKPTAGRWFGAGLILGLLGLTRGNLLLLAPLALILLFAWLRTKAESDELRRAALALIGGLVVIILPITARNYILTGTFLAISNNGGINFYTGSNPQADGYTPILSGLAWERTWYVKAPPDPVTGAPRTLGMLTNAEQDRFWSRQGIAFWLHQPGKALALLVKKGYLYWIAYDIPNNVSYDWGRAHASLLRAIPLMTFSIVGPLALLGIAFGGWRSRESRLLTLFVVVQWLAVIIFFVNGRYRMPAMPVLCLFAALALIELVRRARSQQRRGLGAGIAGLIACAVFVNGDFYGVGRAHGANRDWILLGQSLGESQNLPATRDAFESATKADPDDPDAWVYYGNTTAQAGDPKAAAEAYRHALKLAPDYAMAAAQFAQLSMAQGWPLEEPARLLRRALEAQPSQLQGLTALTRVDVRLGRSSEADDDLERVAKAFSRWSSNDSRYALAQMWVQQAVTEAHGANVAIPQALQPPPEPSNSPQGMFGN